MGARKAQTTKPPAILGFPKTPYTPGEDVVGIVGAVGQDLTKLQVGERVAGWSFGQGSGYSQTITRPANHVSVFRPRRV
ncbi:alcohol dehydrogenase catalytic domain-containing protein [uncultured Litoreibacter sp.]|uniref:alcohol dehydrogenase catalytic domain-containing protein n=1 Tax=uncultured Litoreibacter sp. TaxID=1392394 RepID=UPI00345ACE18